MTPDSPKGPESTSVYQPEARDRVARWYRDQWGYRVNNETTLRHADDALEAVRPEMERLRETIRLNARFTDAEWAAKVAEVERLTAEVERLRALSDERHEIIQGWTRYKARTNEQKRAWRAEVAGLREQLAAQQQVWAPADPTDKSVRLAEALRFVGVVDPDDDCMSVFETRGEGVKHWVPVDAIALRMLEHMSGVSSSEVEAPQPLQHRVNVRMQDGAYVAACSDCPQDGGLGSLDWAQDWKDQHEADTLRPQIQTSSKLEQNLDEGRPSGSERLAPRSDVDEVRALLIHPAAWNGLVKWLDSRSIYVQSAGDLEGIPCWSMGVRELDFSNAGVRDQCDWWTDDRRCPDWAERGGDLCRLHLAERERYDAETERICAAKEQDAAQAARSEATLKKSCRIDGCPNEPGYYGWCPEHSCGAHPDGNLAAGSCQFGQDAPHHVHADRTMVWQDSPYPSLRKEGEDQ